VARREPTTGIAYLQQSAGNQAVQRLIQRYASTSTPISEATLIQNLAQRQEATGALEGATGASAPEGATGGYTGASV
jgi:hypothetical protein